MIRWLVFLLALWGIPLFLLKSFENRLVFPGSVAAESWVPPPDDGITDVEVSCPDGTRIHMWWVPHTNPQADVLVFCHGNGGNLSHRGRTAVDFRRQLDCSVLLFDYPGYGKSGGSPSERGCYSAGEAALAWLESQGVPMTRVVLFGESLGGGVATELAVRRPPKVLVLAKTFTSLPAAAKAHFPWLPTHTLMSNRFDSATKLPSVTRPVFVSHGTADRIVPFELGEALFSRANEPKAFHRMEDQDHNAWYTSDFLTALRAFLSRW